MADQLRFRRGTTAENGAYIGAIGEITVDTERDELRLHDGVTAGGTRYVSQSSGAWTPALKGGTTPGAPTFSAQNGFYVKTGRLVFVTMYVGIVTLGGMDGVLTLDGASLPFAAMTSTGRRVAMQVPYQNCFDLPATENGGVYGFLLAGDVTFYASSSTAGNNAILTQSEVKAGGLYGTMMYETDD
ncbi:MAG: hypothetical protein J0H79_15390 [Alphaproteobacteria bacterium]|nr:hypothetical protein [Alphaproteobacteria bacterium]